MPPRSMPSFSAYRFDAVMHFAALAYVGESVIAPGRYYDVNVNGTRTLLDAMVRAGVRSIVFSSSCAIYGEPDAIPISERTVPNPINPYGFTKLACEHMMDDFRRAYELKSARLRYFNAAGADPTAEIGEDHNPETHLIPLVLDAASGKRPDVTMFGTDYPTPDGTAVRDYVHVCDLARAHVLALEYLLDEGDTIAVNLGTGRGASVRQVVDTVRRITGREVIARDASRRAGDPPALVADSKKAGEVLGWAPQHSDLPTISPTPGAGTTKDLVARACKSRLEDRDHLQNGRAWPVCALNLPSDCVVLAVRLNESDVTTGDGLEANK